MVDTLNALKADSVTELDANAVVGYTLSTTATDSKWSVAKEEDQTKLAKVTGAFKMQAGSQTAGAEITIKTTSDLGEYTPYFMTAGAATNSAAGSGRNIETSIEGFATYEDWKGLLDRVKTLWGQDTEEDKAKLDAFSNALAPVLKEAALRSTVTSGTSVTVTEDTTIFYLKPWTGSFTFGSTSDTTSMVNNGQSTATQIGANKTTLILSGYQDFEQSTDAPRTITANGKPWNKNKTYVNASGSTVSVGNGTSTNYFEINNNKWHFNGGDNKLLGLPQPETATSTTYDSSLAFAIRFLIEAVITDDTMTRTTTPSGEVSNPS
ncbi:hypothetical protein ACA758_04070 [Mycoplasmopsis agassizii]|uniref:hypothetical protein n=1 Tax=Mycoplasmopsis agassizii TaxID=33922 RepID=UPI0035274491